MLGRGGDRLLSSAVAVLPSVRGASRSTRVASTSYAYFVLCVLRQKKCTRADGSELQRTKSCYPLQVGQEHRFKHQSGGG